MAIKDWTYIYPDGIDTTVQLLPIVDGEDKTRASQINTVGSLLSLIETEIGARTPSSGTLRYRVASLEDSRGNATRIHDRYISPAQPENQQLLGWTSASGAWCPITPIFVAGQVNFYENEYTTITGTESFLPLSYTPVNENAIWMYRNGVSMDKVAIVSGTNMDEYSWDSYRLISFLPTTQSGERYTCRYVYSTGEAVVTNLQGRAVSSSAPTASGNTVAWNLGQNQWEPQPQNASLLQWSPISTVTPTVSGETMRWNGSLWGPEPAVRQNTSIDLNMVPAGIYGLTSAVYVVWDASFTKTFTVVHPGTYLVNMVCPFYGGDASYTDGFIQFVFDSGTEYSQTIPPDDSMTMQVNNAFHLRVPYMFTVTLTVGSHTITPKGKRGGGTGAITIGPTIPFNGAALLV